MIFSTFIPILISIASASGTKDITYNIKDLEAVYADKNYEEFLLHVNDIRPSERGKHWIEMYQSMAVLFVDSRIKTKDFTFETYRHLSTIAKSSGLKSDEFFQFKYSLYSKHFFEQCYKKNDLSSCDKEVLNFFSSKSPLDSDLSYDIVNILNKNETSVNKWPFYQIMANDKHASLYCDKSHVQSAILRKIIESSTSLDFSGNYKKLLFSLINQDCFKKLISPLQDTLINGPSSSIDKEISYYILKETENFKENDENLFYVLYLLNGPLVGDLFNISWKKIEILAENYKEREGLINRLKKINLLPDTIFNDPNLPRNKAVINLFAKNFPELLNYYGDSCIRYISMKSDSDSNIKSSQSCNAFLSTASKDKGLNWVSDSINIKYSSLKK